MVGDVLPLGLLQQIAGVVAEELAERPVHLQPAAVGRDNRHPDRREVEHAAEPPLGVLVGSPNHTEGMRIALHDPVIDGSCRFLTPGLTTSGTGLPGIRQAL